MITFSQCQYYFNNMYLKKIIKENHKTTLSEVVINRCEPENNNLVATIGGGQLSIYDSDHCDSHLDIMCNFTNLKTQFTCGGLISSVCWVHAQDRDATLLFGDNDGTIQVISVSLSCVVALLKGHRQKIISIESHPIPGLRHIAVSTSKDETVRIWDTANRTCLCQINVPSCTYAVFSEQDPETVFVSNSKGKILKFDLPEEMKFLDTVDSVQETIYDDENDVGDNLDEREPQTILDMDAGDSIVRLSGYIGYMRAFEEYIALKCRDRIPIVHVPTESIIEDIHVPDSDAKSSKFDIFSVADDRNCSDPEEYEHVPPVTIICVGNNQGYVYVYHLRLAISVQRSQNEDSSFFKKQRKPLCRLEQHKKSLPIHSCIALPHRKSILATSEDGLLWQWYYISPEVIEKYEEEERQEKLNDSN
eukprot:gb/GECH01006977.1/.p1 GENE.gb/GECH01006977.1/~~gb/GECH01006977.1/.p1  ORF type:complete len:419 (+),score=106.66 gb/GECH01006977.1/:1-1257(+)